VRERIQIDNKPICEALFAKYFFEVWDKLSSSGDGSKPVYFRFLTLMAYHTFLREGVDSAVIECGIGGEYDSTNIISSPTVTAVTTLSIDHVGMLGETLPEIAWHKAGIFKTGTVAYTVPQSESAIKVLRERAQDKCVELRVVQRYTEIELGEIKLGLEGDFQKSNASLAVAVAAAHLRVLGVTELPDTNPDQQLPPEIRKGLEQVKWPGRCDLRQQGLVSWCLDGAHTLDSVEVAGQWFAGVQTKTRGKSLCVFEGGVQESHEFRPKGRSTDLDIQPANSKCSCPSKRAPPDPVHGTLVYNPIHALHLHNKHHLQGSRV
jgi:folylpolyglutamate synthase